jgi:hypothetical protein
MKLKTKIWVWTIIWALLTIPVSILTYCLTKSYALVFCVGFAWGFCRHFGIYIIETLNRGNQNVK